MTNDVRFALRQLRKNPGFALAVILMLAIGIGATTSMFSLVDAVLLRPLPFPQSERLTWVQYDDRELGGDGKNTFSYPNYFDFAAQNHSFSALASYRNSGMTLTGAGEARELTSEIVSANFFRLLGVAPLLGRDFTTGDEAPGAHVAMLSWDLWQHAFSARPDIAGAAITLDHQNYFVAGVMPPGFSFPEKTPAAELWTTLSDDSLGDGALAKQRNAGFLNLIGRLKPDVSLTEARADLSVIARNLAAQYPKENVQLTRVILQPELDHLVGDTRPALRVLFAAVIFVLLIGCVNVAGLMLARMSRRRAEIALLAAVGAGRWQILRQILIESIVLSVCGGALGILLAAWGTDAILKLVPSTLPRLDRISIDPAMLLFASAVSVIAGVLAGLLPAWKISRVEPLTALREGNRNATGGRGQHRLQGSLVVVETAISVVLVIGSGLLIRSFIRVLDVKPGFDAHNVLTAKLSVPDTRFPGERRLSFYRDLVPKLRAIPGVEAVSSSWPLPLAGNDINIGFEIEGRPNPPDAEPSEHMAVTTPNFFRLMRIPVEGREFNEDDTTTSKPVIIVNQAFARKYFPGESPLGKRVKSGISDGTVKSAMREIVGVVGSVKRSGLREEFVPQYYLPWSQAVITWPTLVIRTNVDPASIAGAVRATVAALDREVPVYNLSTLDQTIYKAAAEPRFQTTLFACFAAMALLLATIGLYAVLSYMVTQRAGEIAVRMALGARRGNVLALILNRGVALAFGGIVIGLAASALLTQRLASMLYGIQAFDPATFAAVAALLFVVSIGASAAPAFRAARVDPMRVLREQ